VGDVLEDDDFLNATLMTINAKGMFKYHE